MSKFLLIIYSFLFTVSSFAQKSDKLLEELFFNLPLNDSAANLLRYIRNNTILTLDSYVLPDSNYLKSTLDTHFLGSFKNHPMITSTGINHFEIYKTTYEKYAIGNGSIRYEFVDSILTFALYFKYGEKFPKSARRQYKELKSVFKKNSYKSRKTSLYAYRKVTDRDEFYLEGEEIPFLLLDLNSGGCDKYYSIGLIFQRRL